MPFFFVFSDMFFDYKTVLIFMGFRVICKGYYTIYIKLSHNLNTFISILGMIFFRDPQSIFWHFFTFNFIIVLMVTITRFFFAIYESFEERNSISNQWIFYPMQDVYLKSEFKDFPSIVFQFEISRQKNKTYEKKNKKKFIRV